MSLIALISEIAKLKENEKCWVIRKSTMGEAYN
jgi:hypothetical protein